MLASSCISPWRTLAKTWRVAVQASGKQQQRWVGLEILLSDSDHRCNISSATDATVPSAWTLDNKCPDTLYIVEIDIDKDAGPDAHLWAFLILPNIDSGLY